MRCMGTNEHGEPCGAEALADSDWCAFHDPREEWRTHHREASSRGGKASRVPQRPVGIVFDVSTPDATLATLQATGKALAEGRCDRGTANALGILAKNATDLHKVLGYERRLSAVERRLGLREATLAEEDEESGDA